MKNIYIIGFVPLNNVLEEILFLNQLSNNFKITYCYLNYNYGVINLVQLHKNKNLEILEFNNLFSWKKYVKKINQNSIFCFMYYQKLNYLRSIYYVKKNNFKTYDILYQLPFTILTINYSKKISFLRAINYIKKYLFLKNYIYYIYKKKIYKNHISFCNKIKKDTVKINFFDIENKRLNKNKSSLKLKNYILFLDSHIHDGTDSQFLGLQSVNKNSHYDLVNKFIKKVEYVTSKEVIISGHPKYTHDYDNLFDNKKIYFNENEYLIENADTLLVFDSTSVYYGIYKYKKIIHLYSDEIIARSSKITNKYESIKLHSELIDSGLINMNNSNSLTKEIFNFDINKIKYDLFIKKYLYDDNRFSYDVITKYLNEIY